MGCMSEGALAPEFLTISHFTFDQTRIKGQRRQVINRQPSTNTSLPLSTTVWKAVRSMQGQNHLTPETRLPSGCPADFLPHRRMVESYMAA